jgi:hypothetical protein
VGTGYGYDFDNEYRFRYEMIDYPLPLYVRAQTHQRHSAWRSLLQAQRVYLTGPVHPPSIVRFDLPVKRARRAGKRDTNYTSTPRNCCFVFLAAYVRRATIKRAEHLPNEKVHGYSPRRRIENTQPIPNHQTCRASYK